MFNHTLVLTNDPLHYKDSGSPIILSLSVLYLF